MSIYHFLYYKGFHKELSGQYVAKGLCTPKAISEGLFCPCEVFVVHGQCLVLLPLPCDASMRKGHLWSISSSFLEARKLAAVVLGLC